jgi:hypothetical protein
MATTSVPSPTVPLRALSGVANTTATTVALSSSTNSPNAQISMPSLSCSSATTTITTATSTATMSIVIGVTVDGGDHPFMVRRGDHVDACDSDKKWYESLVVDITHDAILVHFLGYTLRVLCLIQSITY